MQYPSTCLSEKPHEARVSDVTLHFSGCLPMAKRRRYVQSLPAEAQERILRRLGKTAALRRKLETSAQDSNAAASLRAFQAALAEWRASHGRPSPLGASSRTPPSPGPYHWVDGGVDADIKASVIYFKDGRPADAPGVPRRFPHQAVTVRELLADDAETNPLMQPREPGVVRYFHLPANNMLWVEEAVARYYHEARPDADDFVLNCKTRRERTRTEMLLRPEFWQGQSNFEPNSEVHARHMRPFSDVISIGAPAPGYSGVGRVWGGTRLADGMLDPVATEPIPKNMVLFVSVPTEDPTYSVPLPSRLTPPDAISPLGDR